MTWKLMWTLFTSWKLVITVTPICYEQLMGNVDYRASNCGKCVKKKKKR